MLSNRCWKPSRSTSRTTWRQLPKSSTVWEKTVRTAGAGHPGSWSCWTAASTRRKNARASPASAQRRCFSHVSAFGSTRGKKNKASSGVKQTTNPHANSGAGKNACGGSFAQTPNDARFSISNNRYKPVARYRYKEYLVVTVLIFSYYDYFIHHLVGLASRGNGKA